jgi:PEGA domain
MITQKPVRRRLARTAALGFAVLLVSTFPLAAQRSAHGGGGSSHSGGSHSSGGGSHSGGGGGTAHSVPGGGNHGGHGGGGGRGFHGGHGGRGFFFYPGFGWGFWPGLSFWWDEPYYPYYDPYYARGYYGGGYGYDGGYGGYDRSELGALDLDVSPAKTHVFVNGEDLGIVDKYDGWPGYLWLPRGTYDIAFYLDGYKTIARQVTVSPGSVLDIDDKMEHGTSVRPEDLGSKTHQRRDDREQYEEWRRQQLEKQGYGDDDWRDRVHRPQAAPPQHPPTPQMDDDDDDGNPPPPPPRMDHNMRRPSRDGRDADRANRGYLRLSVEPDDASVYLDGRFVGTGNDLSMLRGGLAVTPGHHQLSVVRPGRKAEEKDFDVKAGEDLKVSVELEGGSR